MNRKIYHSVLAKKILWQYFTVLGVFVGATIAFGWSVKYILSRKYWYTSDFLWPLLHWIDEYNIFLGIIFCLMGAIGITFIYIFKLLHYTNEIVSAAEGLVDKPDSPVILPGILKETQDELNQVREHANRNARLAKEAEQRKNDLIVYLAHDLKTPLTSVIGYLELLKDEDALPANLRQKYTGIAFEKAERLEELINEFFDITRFSITTMTLDKEPINISRMLEQITSEFAPILMEKDLKWELELEKDIELFCDANKLERVFDNLIRNAVNYSYEDSSINLSLRKSEKKVILKVSNRGKTIAKEKLAHIFEQFFRLDASRSSSTGGAGLGLAIAKEIVELHGGEIFAESQEESITFTVILPE